MLSELLYLVYRLPDNLYCVGGDFKPCSINQSLFYCSVLQKLTGIVVL